MKIYLAAPYQEMALMVEWEKVIKAEGHTSTAKWIHGGETNELMTRAGAAQMDLDDIDRSDAVISKTLAMGTMFSSGGRHVELGYAIARNKLVVIIHEIENVFHYLPQVVRCATILTAAKYLYRLEILSE